METSEFKTLKDLESIDHDGWFRGFTFIQEWRNGNNKYRIHQVFEKGPHSYQQGVSLDSFCRRDLDNWYYNYYMKRKKKPVSFHAMSDIKTTMESNKRTEKYLEDWKWNEEFEHQEIMVHETVWDFYKHIGYDHKNKRYINELDKKEKHIHIRRR